MPSLRTWSHLHRALALLRRIIRARNMSQLDALLERAVEDIEGAVESDLADTQTLESRIGIRLKGTCAEVRRVAQASAESLDRLSELLLVRNEEFKQGAEGICKRTLDALTETQRDLAKLNGEIAAIREYAASQQEMVRRFQEGYDWKILRDFCVRMFRCIESIDLRLGKAAESPVDASDLESIRDELVFGLEASGVEQFQPEVGSPYRGQEKTVEVVGRAAGPTPEHSGRIASIVRPGYLLRVDPDSVRLIRTAQVRVFSKEETGASNG